jgi:hypothetical protein
MLVTGDQEISSRSELARLRIIDLGAAEDLHRLSATPMSSDDEHSAVKEERGCMTFAGSLE